MGKILLSTEKQSFAMLYPQTIIFNYFSVKIQY